MKDNIYRKERFVQIMQKDQTIQEKAAARKRTARLLFFIKSKSGNSVEAIRTPKSQT